jgi:hypothetical protein
VGKANGKRTPKPKNNGKHVPDKKPALGCDVLSLTVENIRCFGPKANTRLL